MTDSPPPYDPNNPPPKVRGVHLGTYDGTRTYTPRDENVAHNTNDECALTFNRVGIDKMSSVGVFDLFRAETPLGDFVVEANRTPRPIFILSFVPKDGYVPETKLNMVHVYPCELANVDEMEIVPEIVEAAANSFWEAINYFEELMKE